LLGNSIVLPNSVITGDTVSGTSLTLTLSGGTSVTYAVGSGISAGKLAISSNGHTLSAYGNAVASSHAPEPVALGAVRVGGTLGGTLSIGNAAPTSGPFENLGAAIGSASASVLASGSFTGLAAGATDSTDLTVGLNTGTAGSIAGTAIINLYSDGTGLDTAGKSSIGTQVVNVTGSVYGTAVAQLGASALNFGIVHVGDPAALATETLTIGNGATGALTDFLTGGFGAISGVGFSNDGLSLDVAAGSNGVLEISLSTSAAGSFTGAAALALFSHDAYLADLGLSAGPVSLQGVVDNYAVAALEETSGGGSVTSQSATSTAIDLGQIALGASPVNVALEALNAAMGTADLLGGTLTAAGSSAFSNSGLGSFSGLAAGGTDTAPLITLTTSSAGTFTETITLVANGSNASGYMGGNQTDTFSITGTIVGPETITLLSSAGTYTGGPANDTFVAANATLVAGDVINGAGGTNTLSLKGGGVFDLSQPASITSVQLLQAQEGQAAYKTIASTYETVTLASGLNLAVNVGPGTPNGANPNASGILINGAANSDVITLGNGTDKVAGLGASESVVAGSGTDLIQAVSGNAGALVTGHAVASTTLELTTGGAATLNANDTQLTVKLDTNTNLQLGTLGFITVIGSAGNDVLTAGAANQTLIGGGGGGNTLNGFNGGGDVFQDTSAHFSADTVVNWTTGDMLDLTDMSTSGSLSYAGNSTSGKLTVSDGTHTATIAFKGNFTTTNFGTLSTDGHGGSLIAYHS
jgi:filamentous hemagglutinin